MSTDASGRVGDGDDVWTGLGLSFESLCSLDGSFHAIAPSATLTPDDAESIARAPGPEAGLDVAMSRATEACVSAARDALRPASDGQHVATLDNGWYIEALDRIAAEFESIDESLAACEKDIEDMRKLADSRQSIDTHGLRAGSHLSAFIDAVILDPALVRHIVDGRVDDDRYVDCIRQLSKKQAVLDMSDARRAAAYAELKPVLEKLILTASSKVSSFLMSKMDLLRRPNTNVQIIKENVLLRYSNHIRFLDELAHDQFLIVRSAYIETMAPLYLALFKKYASGLMSLKTVMDGASEGIVGTIAQPSSVVGVNSQSLAGFLGNPSQALSDPVTTGSSPIISSSTSKGTSRASSREDGRSYPRRNSISAASTTAAAAAPSQSGLFSLGKRIDVLAKIDSPPIVLAVAESNNFRFYFEELHRSLGRMLSETCASEHTFCAAFFGESEGRMFSVFFKDVVNALLETVASHAADTKDMIGILLALKVNEAQRRSMVHRNIMDLSDYFIRVDIALKPKFKKLFDAHVTSLSVATKLHLRTLFPGDADRSPHIITRQFAELSAAVLSIASYGPSDDAIQEGLRRMRTEYYSFLTAMSALYMEPKSRYIFLVNNTDLVLTTYTTRGVTSAADTRYFSEVQVGHTASYVEHEVCDHFPSLVSFVRTCERSSMNSGVRGASRNSSSGARERKTNGEIIAESKLRQILREFGSNWHLGVAHMRDSVLRAFPNFRTGNDVLRAMFARLLTYCRKCEAVVTSEFPAVKNELVSITEISFEIRQLSKSLTQDG